MQGGPLDIALTFDDGFWAPAYATMRSVSLASHRRSELVFHAIHSGLTAAHRDVLDRLPAEFPVTLRHHDLAGEPAYQQFTRGLPVAFAYSPVIYARLLLDRLVPDATRIVYLDSDLLVRGPIEALFDIDLNGKSLGAVLDPHRHRAMLGRDFRLNADLFDFRQAYFYSGVLVIDRGKYAAADLPGLMQRLTTSGVMARIQFDQAALNIAFRDDWLPLDFRWNLTNPTPAHEVLEPNVVHYTGPRKPWSLLPRVAFAQAYRHTMTNALFYRYWRERQVGRVKGWLRLGR